MTMPLSVDKIQCRRSLILSKTAKLKNHFSSNSLYNTPPRYSTNLFEKNGSPTAGQEFLASFGVDIDEGGVTRLQNILTQDQDPADDLAVSFETAAAVRFFSGYAGRMSTGPAKPRVNKNARRREVLLRALRRPFE